MTTRLNTTFATLKSANKTAFIPFIMGGDPDRKTTQALLQALPKAGADIIEIGIPFSDPMADGPVIEAAGLRALKAGMNLATILQIVAEFRTHDNATPIVLMGYYNPIYAYGAEKFAQDAKQAGVDGLIIVDLPPEEEAELTPSLTTHGLDLIRLVAPTTDLKRQSYVTAHASGFVYYISVKGITGGEAASGEELKLALDRLRQSTDLPLAIGFGIKTPDQAKAAAQHADAVVVGSAIVDSLAKQGMEAAVTLTKSLADAVHSHI